MSDLKMGPVETRFAEIIWEKEPVGSMELVKLAEEALGWKKQFVEESFSGSLPAFITAFTRRKKLSEDEITQLQKLIDQNRR